MGSKIDAKEAMGQPHDRLTVRARRFMIGSRQMREISSEPIVKSEPAHRSGPHWRAAVEAGFDMSLVELSLAKSPWERMRDHDQALAFAEELRQGVPVEPAP